MKRKLRLILMLGLCLSIGIPSFAFAVASNESVEMTVGDAENELTVYLQKYHPEIQIGSEQYVDFLVDLLMFEDEKMLEKHPQYEEIKIYASEYLDQISSGGMVESKTVGNGDEIKILLDKEKQKKIETVKLEAVQQERLDAILENENSSQLVPYSAYSNNKAVAYAKKWAKDWNRAYGRHTADCTNFVSQCVFAGGKTMKKPSGTLPLIKKTTNYWYSVRFPNGRESFTYRESSSFINVGDFYTYWKQHGVKTVQYSTKKKLQNGVVLGNVVQLKNGKGKWFHSIIITGGEKGARTYCGHSKPSLDQPISKISTAVAYRAIKF